MKWLADLASGIVSPITKVFTKKNDNKTKIKKAQIDRLVNAEDKLSEWETIQAENSNDSWKDEYITLIVTLPLATTFIAVFCAVVFNEPELAKAASEGVRAVKELVPNYEELLYIVCLAALGIRAIRR